MGEPGDIAPPNERIVYVERPKKKRRWLWALGILGVIIIVAAAASGGEDSTIDIDDTPSGGGTTALTQPAPGPSTYALGQPGKSSELTFTVYGVQDPWVSPNQFTRAPEGSRHIIVDIEVRNTTSSQQSWTGIFLAHAVDTANRQYDIEPVAGLPTSMPSGEIPAGGSVRGWMAFEVPATAAALRVRLQGSSTAAGAYFKLS